MRNKNPVFEKTNADYLEQIGRIDLAARAETLGLEIEGRMARLPFFGEVMCVSEAGILSADGERPDFITRVIIYKYLLLSPGEEIPVTSWSHYRDFKDSGPLTVYYAHEVEMALADYFCGRVDLLCSAAERLSGRRPDLEAACDCAFSFQALPRIPMLLMFNDADEDFGADCSVLFGNSAGHYLDGESLAMLGRCLFERLRQGCGRINP